ncbi:MAG: OmpA family protein [Pseudorhodoplanes sp.]|nr:OmpA family protein [Pseudorhodoplanes sp.]
MKSQTRKRGIAKWGIAIAVGAVLLAAPDPILAGDQPTEAQILDALKPRAKTRSLGATRSLNGTKSDKERRFIDGLRTRSARSLTVEEREKVAEIAREKPRIDLEINFDFNSATVGTQAVPVLLTLGRALSKDELKGTVFLINGHTDAKGSFEYNQDLSERRAEAVKRLLVEQFNLPATTLVAIGYGKTKLKNDAYPLAGENRRVQIVNTEVR